MKGKASSYLIIAIGFIVYNLLAFVIPSAHSGAFWVAYAFGAVSFVLAAVLWKRAMDNGKKPVSKYYRVPLLQIGLIYVIVSTVLLLVFKFVPVAPMWLAFLICGLLLCGVCIGLISADSAVEAGEREIERIEEHIERKRGYLKEMQIRVETLAASETDSEIREKLTALAKKIRLSDPMSDDSVAELENRILSMIDSIRDSTDKAGTIDEISAALLERNSRVKAQKS